MISSDHSLFLYSWANVLTHYLLVLHTVLKIGQKFEKRSGYFQKIHTVSST